MDAQIRTKLEMTVTTFDRKQSTRPGYNPNALAMYLTALDEVASLVADGKPLRWSLDQWFYGPLLTALLRAID